MFQLAVRLWTKNGMLYPIKFSVMYDTAARKSSVRAIVKNDKYVSEEYMLITPFDSLTGPVFEKDIVMIDDNPDMRLVQFSEENGRYEAINLNDKKDIIVMTSLHNYDIIGNLFEDKDLLEGTEYEEKIDVAEEVVQVETKEEISEGKEAEIITAAAMGDDTAKILEADNEEIKSATKSESTDEAAEAFKPENEEVKIDGNADVDKVAETKTNSSEQNVKTVQDIEEKTENKEALSEVAAKLEKDSAEKLDKPSEEVKPQKQEEITATSSEIDVEKEEKSVAVTENKPEKTERKFVPVTDPFADEQKKEEKSVSGDNIVEKAKTDELQEKTTDKVSADTVLNQPNTSENQQNINPQKKEISNSDTMHEIHTGRIMRDKDGRLISPRRPSDSARPPIRQIRPIPGETPEAYQRRLMQSMNDRRMYEESRLANKKNKMKDREEISPNGAPNSQIKDITNQQAETKQNLQKDKTASDLQQAKDKEQVIPDTSNKPDLNKNNATNQQTTNQQAENSNMEQGKKEEKPLERETFNGIKTPERKENVVVEKNAAEQTVKKQESEVKAIYPHENSAIDSSDKKNSNTNDKKEINDVQKQNKEQTKEKVEAKQENVENSKPQPNKEGHKNGGLSSIMDKFIHETQGGQMSFVPEREPDESDYFDKPEEEEKSACKNTTGKAVRSSLYFVSSCYNEHGSYVFSIISNGTEETYFGKEDNTNSKKIILQGLIDALATYEGIFNVTVYTDSQYVIYPFLKGWINKWKNSNWYKNDTDRIQNYELWGQLLELADNLNVRWKLVESSDQKIKSCMEILNKNS